MIKTHYFIGTSGWTYDDWQGTFYPKNIPKKDWLSFYTNHFSTVELNATFYRHFDKTVYEKWYHKVPANFRFVVKVPRLITHFKQLKNCSELIHEFETTSNALKHKRALMLLQLSPNMPYDLNQLQNALLCFEQRESVAVEFRNTSWMTKETRELLEVLGCIFCSTDSPAQLLEKWVTADTAYIRLHGHTKWYDYNYSQKELVKIAKLANDMAAQGAKNIYIFFNNDYNANAVYNAKTLQQLLG